MGTSKTTDPVKMDSRRAYSSEQELAQMYSVSVGTVRKAVEGLVEDGLLVKQQGKELSSNNLILKIRSFVFRLRNKKASSFSHKDKSKSRSV